MEALPYKLVIQGGYPLNGTVRLSGAKNSVLKLMAGALLTPHPVTLRNVPRLADVRVMAEVVKQLGCKVMPGEDDTITLCASDINPMNWSAR